jgi:hypothetical protein
LECTVSEFFTLGWSNGAREGFSAECHRIRGETDVLITDWSRHKHHGHARNVTFVAPTNSSIGPRVANCHQTQSYHLCRGGVLVIDTSQVMDGIPFADYFRVETRWEVRPDASGRAVKLWVGLRVPFHRTTMMRSFIEQSTREQSKSSVATVVGLMRAKLRERKSAVGAGGATASPSASPRGARAGSGVAPEVGGGGLQRHSGGDGEDRVDVSKLNIPEGSRDVIWRMLFGGGSMKKSGSGENSPRGDGGGGFGAAAKHSPRDASRAASLARGSGDASGGGANVSPDGSHSELWASGEGGVGGGDFPSPRGAQHHGGGRGAFAGIFGSGGLLGGGFGVVALIVLSGALIVALQVAWVLSRGVLGGGGGGSLFGHFGRSGMGVSSEADVAFWQRRAALLSAELDALERRVAFVAAEVAHAQGALKEASARTLSVAKEL